MNNTDIWIAIIEADLQNQSEYGYSCFGDEEEMQEEIQNE